MAYRLKPSRQIFMNHLLEELKDLSTSERIREKTCLYWVSYQIVSDKKETSHPHSFWGWSSSFQTFKKDLLELGLGEPLRLLLKLQNNLEPHSYQYCLNKLSQLYPAQLKESQRLSTAAANVFKAASLEELKKTCLALSRALKPFHLRVRILLFQGPKEAEKLLFSHLKKKMDSDLLHSFRADYQ
jgi:hypothetical protein